MADQAQEDGIEVLARRTIHAINLNRKARERGDYAREHYELIADAIRTALAEDRDAKLDKAVDALRYVFRSIKNGDKQHYVRQVLKDLTGEGPT